MMPGITMPPDASISTVPSGTSSPGRPPRSGRPRRGRRRRVSTCARRPCEHRAAAQHHRWPAQARHGPLGVIAVSSRSPDDLVRLSGQRRDPSPALCAVSGRGVKTSAPGEGGMPRPGTGPDFIEALARGLDVIPAFRRAAQAMSLSDGRRRDRAGPAHRPAHPAHPAELGYVRAGGAAFALTPGCWTSAWPTSSRRAVGGGPAAPWRSCRRNRRVLLDRPARRLGHRLRRPGRGTARSSPCRSQSARGSRPCRPRWARCCSRRWVRDELDGCSPSRHAPDSPPLWQPGRASATPRCARCGRAGGR